MYNLKLKGVPFAGNLAVAFLGGLAFVYGGIAGGEPMRALVPGLFAMLFHMAREIIKDAADVRGDSIAGLRTIATVRGVQAASWCASLIFLILGAAVAIPCAIGLFGLVYMIIIALGIWPVLAWAAASSIVHPSEENLRKIAFVLKLDMPVGVIAILVGFQGW
jgi:geranylgeranylglycerol-phosphate geranylgeranyltransferase